MTTYAKYATRPLYVARLAAMTVAIASLWGCTNPQRTEKIAASYEHFSAGSDPIQPSVAAIQRESTVDDRFVSGNKIELLIDGPQTYDDMFGAIAVAQDHVNLETFFLADDAIRQRLVDALAERAANGVIVNVIYDAVGSMASDDAFFDNMRERRINLLAYHPLLDTEPSDWHNRNHRKILMIDGRVGFTGGLNFAKVYRFSSETPSADKRFGEGWRDTHVNISGPAVALMQRPSLSMWEDCAYAG